MKLAVKPQNPLERLALAAGLVPEPFIHSLPTLLLARCVVTATRLGLFEALAHGPATAEEVAAHAGTHPVATGKLLAALVGIEYLTWRDGRFELGALPRRWLLAESESSLVESMEYRVLEWEWIARLDDYVVSGEPLRIHDEMTPDEWQLYQRGMAAGARVGAPELVRRLPVPAAARDLLDIGGAHGLYAVGLCRRHAGLRAVVLDLPPAIEHAAPILAAEEMGERVVHRPGDALREDLGEARWDVVLLSQLAHHFDAATNRDLTRRVARALRPGGVFAIHEVVRAGRPGEGGQFGALAGIYFALTSESGTFGFEEMAAWQRDAGLEPQRPVRLRSAPGYGLQIAIRPASR